MQNLRLALRLLAREWRAGELRLFAAALVIAVGAVTAVGFFNDRVTRAMTFQSAELLGADLVLLSPQPAAPNWIEEASRQGLRHAEAVEFASVVVKGDKLQLSSVRSVSRGYPLRGAIRTAPALYAPDAVTRGIPQPGTAWVEARVMNALSLKIGDRIEIGAAGFTVTRVLTYEPGRGGNFVALAPRVLISQADVARTRVIQPGSRVTYAYGFADRTEAGAARQEWRGGGFAAGERALRSFHGWLKTRLGPSQRVLDVQEGNTTSARAIERVDRYVGLTSLLAVVLAGVAIAMGARRYTERHYDMSAMLRCFGATQNDIVALHLPQLLLLGVVASLVGVALGWMAQEAIAHVMRNFFPVALPTPGPVPVLFGLLTGLVTLIGFGFAPVLRLRSVPPLRVLRRELAPVPPSAWAVYGSAAAAILVLMWRYTASWALTLGVLAGTIAVTAALALIAFALLHASRRLRGRAGAAWRFGFNNLLRRAQASVSQILAFGLALMAMAVIALVRTDLLSTWQTQLPQDTPNQFAFNILPSNVAPMQRFFAQQRIDAQALYPMVRGRLVAINGVPVEQAARRDETDNEALQRELNLSWTSTVPPDNTLLRGVWWDSAAKASVSVEEKLAQKLGIDVGTDLTFSVDGDELTARVASIRKVQWDSFHPNFFMLFPPGVLDAYPTTYITSFYLKPGQKPLLTSLVHAFPEVTVIETDQVLAQIRAILREVTLAVELVLLFVLAAGFAVLYAALATSLDERFREGALLRTLGASRRQLRAGHVTEFVTLGVLAGFLAAIGTELIAYILYSRVFDLDYTFKWPVWLIAPVAGGLLIGVAGYVGTRRVVERSPLTVLREI